MVVSIEEVAMVHQVLQAWNQTSIRVGEISLTRIGLQKQRNEKVKYVGKCGISEDISVHVGSVGGHCVFFTLHSLRIG